MDEFSDDDVYAVEVFKDPKADWLRVFRNGAMAIGCLPVRQADRQPAARASVGAGSRSEVAPSGHRYEEMARDDGPHEPVAPG